MYTKAQMNNRILGIVNIYVDNIPYKNRIGNSALLAVYPRLDACFSCVDLLLISMYHTYITKMQ